MTDTFNFECSAGTAGAVTHNVSVTKFGDGYAQFAKNGINARGSQWSVTIANMQQAQSDAVTGFIDAHAGKSFFWTPPRSIKRGLFLCSKYTLTPVEFGLQSITATFEEVFFP